MRLAARPPKNWASESKPKISIMKTSASDSLLILVHQYFKQTLSSIYIYIYETGAFCPSFPLQWPQCNWIHLLTYINLRPHSINISYLPIPGKGMGTPQHRPRTWEVRDPEMQRNQLPFLSRCVYGQTRGPGASKTHNRSTGSRLGVPISIYKAQHTHAEGLWKET